MLTRSIWLLVLVHPPTQVLVRRFIEQEVNN